jgi:hypothetical protein
MISGRASRDYACGFKRWDVIPTVDTLTNLFGYFSVIHTYNVKLRYFDWDGQVHLVKGKTGGQQGDPLEMLTFNLTIHHLWGRVLAKFQGAQVITYADDGQQQGAAPLSLPSFNNLFEASFVRDEIPAPNADVAVIPSQHKVTQQILRHW